MLSDLKAHPNLAVVSVREGKVSEKIGTSQSNQGHKGQKKGHYSGSASAMVAVHTSQRAAAEDGRVALSITV